MNSFRRLENHSPSVDLRYYALSFQEKEREAKRREKESLNAIAEKEILKIKKTPWTAFAGNRGIVNEKSIDDVEDESANDYFVDLLNCNHLLTIKGIRLRNFQLLRLLLSSSSRDSNNEKINPHSEKSTALSNFISIFRNVARYIGNVTHIFYRRCIYFIYRAVGLYYCFKLSNHVQRLIVPLKDIKLLKKIHTSDHRIIYFLENPSLYHIMLLIYLFYWNDIEMPAIYFRADDKTRIWWILRNMGVTIIDLEALIGIEDGIFDYKKLQAQIENLFERKKAIAFFSKSSYTNSGVDDLVRVIMKANSCNCVVSDVILATVNFSSENAPFNYIENSLFLKKAAKYSYNFFKNNFGIVQVKIGTPFSLKEIIASSHITSHSQTISRTDVITKNVVTRLNFEFSRSRILMSTHLVSFIMLYKFRDGVKFVDLVKTVDALRNKLTFRKNCLLGFSGTTENVVKHAIKILDKKLEVVQTNIECIIKPVLTLPDVLDLFRLSAVALDYFILDAAIMTCIQVQFKSVLEDAFKSDKNTLTFYYNDFVEKIEQLCEILQVQFSFQGPNQNLSNEISNALFKYVELECFVKNEKFLTDEERWGHRFAKHLESDDEDDSYYTRNRGDTYSVKFDTNPDLYQEIIFFHKCLQPIIETYVVVFDNLAILLKEPIIHQELVKQTFFTLKSYFDDGRLKYPESVSLELVLKSIELLEISNNLKSYTVDEIKIYYLNKENDGSTNLHDIEYKLRYFQR